MNNKVLIDITKALEANQKFLLTLGNLPPHEGYEVCLCTLKQIAEIIFNQQ